MLPTPVSDADQILNIRAELAKPPREREIPPVEVGRVLSAQIDREPIVEVAERIGFRDLGTLRQFVRLTTLPTDLQQLVTWGRQPGKLSFTVASVISRARSANEQRHLADLAVQNGWSKSDVQKALRDRTEKDG